VLPAENQKSIVSVAMHYLSHLRISLRGLLTAARVPLSSDQAGMLMALLRGHWNS
jgi:hypothetical protein